MLLGIFRIAEKCCLVLGSCLSTSVSECYDNGLGVLHVLLFLQHPIVCPPQLASTCTVSSIEYLLVSDASSDSEITTSGRTFLVPIGPFEGGFLGMNLLSSQAQPHEVLIIDFLVDCSGSIQNLLRASLRPRTSLTFP